MGCGKGGPPSGSGCRAHSWHNGLSHAPVSSYNVWCGFWAGGIIGPYFFENEAGAAVSVNGLRYRTMINEFLWPELEDMDVGDVCFQQDGAMYHTSGETIGLSREKLLGRVISRNGD